MSDNLIKTTQAVGILGSAFASGSILSISFFMIPTLAIPARQHEPLPSTQQPGTPLNHLTHQWLYLYHRGRDTIPPLASAASIAYLSLAWTARESAAKQGGPASLYYVTAALATVGIVPFTLLVMMPTNNRLEARTRRDDAVKAEGDAGMAMSDQERAKREREDMEVPALLRKWARLNAVRAMFPMLGAIVGFYATLLA